MTTAFDSLAAIGARLADRTDSAELYQDIARIVRSATRCDTLALSQYNPVTGRHETIINLDYPKTVLHHLNTWFVENDEVYHYMRSEDHKPLRWKDMPFRYESMFSAERVFRPCGFNEGVTVCLYNRDGRYTGALHVSATDRRQPPDDAMQLLSALQTLLGTFCDWWSLQLPTGATDHAIRVVVDQNRRLWFRPESPEPLRSHIDDAISMSLPRSLDRLPDQAFLHWEGLTFVVRSQYSRGRAVLDVRTADVPANLTKRELDVSTFLIRGLTNAEIAERLQISTKTVSRHVENIMGKMGVPTRTAAAVKCAELGLQQWETQ